MILEYPNLAAEMARRGETQKDLARLLVISEPSISMKMQGKRGFKMEEINAILDHYEKPFEELFRKGL